MHDRTYLNENIKPIDLNCQFKKIICSYINGIEATTIILKVQESEGFSDTPIIALTADALEGAKEKYLQAGMKEYLSKPLDEEQLHRVLSKYLQK